MKAIFNKTLLFATVLSAGLLTSCINDDDYSVPELSCDETTLVKNMEPQAVPASAAVAPYADNEAIPGDDIIEAYVTSSDLGGNFFKSISFQTMDGSFGFSIPVDVASYAAKFDVGRKVLINLNGTYTDIANGSLRIGALFQGQVGRLSAADYSRVLNRSCTVINEEDLKTDLSIAEAKNNVRINTLIELQNVQFRTEDLNGTYYRADNALGGATNLYLVDEAGNNIIFRTSSFATYAGSRVARGSGTVRGVLTKFGNDFQFVARYESDIKLDQPRIGGDVPVENPGGEGPGANAVLLYQGSDFENAAAFNAGINAQFGIKPYATISAGTGQNGSASLKINTTGAAGNDYVFNSKAATGLPATYSKVTFYVKGTSSKSLSINLYKPDNTYYRFNLGDVSASKTITPFETNQYTGVINTNNQWVLITLDLSSITDLNTTNTNADIFALKVGSASPYDLYIDNFKIE